MYQGRHLRGAGGPSPPKEKEKRKKKEKKEKREKKERKKKERKKGTVNNVKLLHIKCCFFQFFNSPVALKNEKKICPPPPRKSWNDAPDMYVRLVGCIPQNHGILLCAILKNGEHETEGVEFCGTGNEHHVTSAWCRILQRQEGIYSGQTSKEFKHLISFFSAED